MKCSVALLMFCAVAVMFAVPVAAAAEVTVGVKQGDWVEYNIEYTGSPPTDYPTWMRVEVLDVQGTNITLEATRELINGTTATHSFTANLETGAPDLFIVPADLEDSDTFSHADIGNITVAGVQDVPYAGVKRTIVIAVVIQILFRWDRATGVLVEATQSASEFTQHLKLDKTNMWQAQPLGLPIDSTSFYVLIIAALCIVAVLGFYVLRRKKQHTS
jgi:ribosomal protein L14